MHPTRIDLDKKLRKKVIELLARRLADAQDLYFMAKHAHWNVRGPQFISLHELFDKVADGVEGHIDDLAERIAQFGGQVAGTLAQAARATSLTPYPADVAAGADHVAAMADALAQFAALVRTDIDSAAKLGDAGTADLFTEISRDIDKLLWFVEAHAQADR